MAVSAQPPLYSPIEPVGTSDRLIFLRLIGYEGRDGHTRQKCLHFSIGYANIKVVS